MIDSKLVSPTKIGVMCHDIASITLLNYHRRYPYNVPASIAHGGIYDLTDLFMSDVGRFNSYLPHKLKLEAGHED